MKFQLQCQGMLYSSFRNSFLNFFISMFIIMFVCRQGNNFLYICIHSISVGFFSFKIIFEIQSYFRDQGISSVIGLIVWYNLIVIFRFTSYCNIFFICYSASLISFKNSFKNFPALFVFERVNGFFPFLFSFLTCLSFSFPHLPFVSFFYQFFLKIRIVILWVQLFYF